jgi:hypothetical protein
MFLRIFRYRVKPQMRDRHLAVQARAARLYEQHVQHRPTYFRRSGDPNSWVELHWYTDKTECQRVAAAVADDAELARLWRDFQDTLDADYPPSLEEYGEYELPRPVNASPFSQPPIDAANQTPPSHVAPPAATQVAEAPPVAGKDESPAEGGAIDDSADDASARDASAHDAADHAADNGEAKRRDEAARPQSKSDSSADDETAASGRTMWPQPPLPETETPAEHPHDESAQDDIVIEDDAPIEPRQSNSLSFNDGVWIVEPEDKPRYPRGDEQ